MRVATHQGMHTPLQVSFHQLQPSPALEARIRSSVGELEKFFDGIVSCHVFVEAPHRHHHEGWLYQVRIEIGVPGDRLVAGRSPNADACHADPYLAVRDAFDAARRQLEDYVGRLRARREAR
jgi:ribosome-associated translation inhibitor RaiA